jgi:hypothetical protein
MKKMVPIFRSCIEHLKTGGRGLAVKARLLRAGPVYPWLAYFCWAARRTKLSPGLQEMGLSATGMQRYTVE